MLQNLIGKKNFQGVAAALGRELKEVQRGTKPRLPTFFANWKTTDFLVIEIRPLQISAAPIPLPQY